LPNIPFQISGKDQNNAVCISNVNEPIVLFVGFMHHSPNSDGVDYFIKNIWGKVKVSIPGAIFRIVGNGVTPEEKVAWEKYDGISVLGFVSDIQSEYNKCKATVVPIFYGAGTNIKVLESMSMRRACVISKFSARAFKNDLIDYKNILIARDDQDFANKTIQLLLDENLNSYIANNAAKTIKDKFSYTVFKGCVNRYLS
jgi:glycosyltransferase involved in cell wall biosynthesis